MIRFSFANRLTTAPIVAMPASNDEVFGPGFLRYPERPFKPWKSRDNVMAQNPAWDLAPAVPVDVIAVINSSVDTMALRGHATVPQGTTYNQAITLTRSATGRRNYGHRTAGFGGFALRYFNVNIGAGLTPDPDPNVYLTNPALETWDAGTSVAPTGWALVGAGATVARVGIYDDGGGKVKQGDYAAKLTRVGADASLQQNVDMATWGPVTTWGGRRVTLTADVWASVASRALVYLYDGVSQYNSGFGGGSDWQTLSVTATLAANATEVRVCLAVITGNTAAYFDNVRLTVTNYSVGGLWVGALTSPPRDILMDPEETSETPYVDQMPPHNGWRQRSRMGPPLFRLRATRLASGEAELAAWREIDRQFDASDYALVCLRDNYPAETYVMRRLSVSRWKHGRLWSESEMELEEMIR